MYCEFIDNHNFSFALQGDLKTINGYLNRAKKIKAAPGKHCASIKIYYCNDSIGYYSNKTKTQLIHLS